MTEGPFPIRKGSTPAPADRWRDIAYLCFLGLGAAVLLTLAIGLLGAPGWLPQPVMAGLLVFILLPLTGAGLLAGIVGMVLAVIVRSDPRLYALSIAALALFVFRVRQEALGVNPAWTAVYPVGAVLLSLRWWLEKRAGRATIK